MKKITLIAALAFGAMGINAQELNFVREGNVVPDGTVLEVTTPKDKGGGFGEMNAELFVQNPGSDDVKAELTISVLEGEGIAYCHFMDGMMGTCMVVNKDKPLARTRTMKAGETHDPEVHNLVPFKLDDEKFKFNSTVEFKLVYGGTTKKVTVKYNYNPGGSSISSVYGENNVYVADNALQYAFDKAANRSLNIYSITGSLVKSEVLDNAGSVALDNLNKGVYLYEIMENGKRIAAHKCVIR